VAASCWRPAPIGATLRLRAELLARIRAFFAARGVLEVETPALSAAAIGDPHLASFATVYSGTGIASRPDAVSAHLAGIPDEAAVGGGQRLHLPDRPGLSRRRGGPPHNPEFTLLEWYRLGFDHHRLMAKWRNWSRSCWLGAYRWRNRSA
jgi:lysyl-tRNA synthetase class 2